jgi:uncharacterized protein
MFIKKKPFKNFTQTDKKPELQSSDMVECSTCGIFAQLDDCIISNNKYYCSSECVDKA